MNSKISNGMVRISAIAAIGARTRALGRDNDLIWDIPEDLTRFRELTTGHPIIMGRKTFESIGKALPNRTNIVVSRNTDYEVEGCIIAHSVDEALEQARKVESEEIFIIGGSFIFDALMSQIDRLYLTLVDDDSDADVYFPPYKNDFTNEIQREDHQIEKGLKYTYLTLDRPSSP